MLVSALFLYFTFIIPYAAKVAENAESSPFSAGFVNLAAEIVARFGVLYLTLMHSEFVPLWWVPLFILGLVLLRWRFPMIVQSDLSPTVRLCLLTALIAAGIMVLLTATALPVGVEFLPARLAYCFPPMLIAVGEWILRRSTTLRWPALLALLNLMALGVGYDAAARSIQIPSPAPGAPFLHATYLQPTPGLMRYLPTPGSGRDNVICETPGLEFALLESGWDHSGVLVESMVGRRPLESPPDFDFWARDLWVITSTRDLTPAGERAIWEKYLSNFHLVEEWQFVHEDPQWLWAKHTLLRRSVVPYKYVLRHFDSGPSASVH